MALEIATDRAEFNYCCTPGATLNLDIASNHDENQSHNTAPTTLNVTRNSPAVYYKRSAAVDCHIAGHRRASIQSAYRIGRHNKVAVERLERVISRTAVYVRCPSARSCC